MKTYNQILQKIAQFANAHIQVQKVDFDFLEQMGIKMSKDNKWPVIYVVPIQNNVTQNQYQYTIDVYCLDYITQGRENINDLVSDTDLILKDLHRWLLDDPTNRDFEINNIPNILPLNNYLLDNMAGNRMRLEIWTDVHSVCDIPFEFNPDQPIPACPQVTYLITLDGEIIEQGSINAGGELEFDLTSNPALYQLLNSLGNEINSGSIIGNDNEIIIDDSLITNSLGNTLISLPSTEPYQVPNSVITNTLGNTLSNLPATEPFVAPDGTVTVNRDGAFFTDVPVVSGESESINVPSFANKFPTKTGQTDSFATMDDGDEQFGRENTFFLLTNNNPFGHKRRFTGKNGGYHVNITNTFFDVNGVTTTKVLAFAGNVCLDWAHYSGDVFNGTVDMWHILPIFLGAGTGGNPIWINYMQHQFQSTVVNSVTIPQAAYDGKTNWRLPNLNQLFPILRRTTGGHQLGYEPFNETGNNTRIITNETAMNNTELFIEIRNTVQISASLLKSTELVNSRVAFYRRTATYTKDPITGVVTIN